MPTESRVSLSVVERRVVVLNQYAIPRSVPGGTRHVELFERLEDWTPQLIAGRLSLQGAPVPDEGSLTTVWVSPVRGNDVSRVLNWLSFFVTAFARGLRRPRPDVVWGSSPQMLAALAAWMLARIRRAVFVMEVRDLWPQTLVDLGFLHEGSRVHRVLRGLEYFLYRRAARIVVLAEGSVEELVAGGIERDRIVFLPNGADPDDFVPSASREVLRDKYGFSGFVVVYAGAHGPANGLAQVLDAAASFSDGDDVHFVLVGDGVEKPALQDRAQRDGLTNVHFMDPVPKDEMADVLHAADAGLHCLADIELFTMAVSPNKLYDYMAAALPVVTNTPGEVAGMVETANSGVAVAPAAIAEGVQSLTSLTPFERRALGENGRAFMGARRSRSALAGQLEHLLDEVVS